MPFIQNTDDTVWNEFILKDNRSGIFNTTEWESLLNKAYGFNISRLIYTDETADMVSGIQVCELKGKAVSLPFTDYYNLIGSNMEGKRKIFSHLIEKYNGQKIQVRGVANDSRFSQYSESVVHHKELGSGDELENIDDSHKRGIKKAVKSGLKVVTDEGFIAVEKFYNMHTNTRKRQGVPVQPFNFFRLLHSEVISKGLGFTSIVYKGDIPVSGGIFLFFNKTFTYKFGESDARYLELRPNNLLFAEMIEYARQNGYEIFDFGKTDIPNTGLRRFKSGWGAKEEPLYYSYYPAYKENKTFKYINKYFVVPLIKHSPKFVCKTVGEIFYKKMA